MPLDLGRRRGEQVRSNDAKGFLSQKAGGRVVAKWLSKEGSS
jgi:hypothetical protein